MSITCFTSHNLLYKQDEYFFWVIRMKAQKNFVRGFPHLQLRQTTSSDLIDVYNFHIGCLKHINIHNISTVFVRLPLGTICFFTSAFRAPVHFDPFPPIFDVHFRSVKNVFCYTIISKDLNNFTINYSLTFENINISFQTGTNLRISVTPPRWSILWKYTFIDFFVIK
jgi:hypothetical protein